MSTHRLMGFMALLGLPWLLLLGEAGVVVYGAAALALVLACLARDALAGRVP